MTLLRQRAIDAQNRLQDAASVVCVTSGLTRLSLGLFAALAVGAVVWSAFLHVPIRLKAGGILVAPADELTVAARSMSGGTVAAIKVGVGHRVRAGDAIAEIGLADREAEITKAERSLNDLLRQLQTTEQMQAREKESEAKIRAIRKASTEQRIRDLLERVDAAGKREQAFSVLLAKQVVTTTTYFAARNDQLDAQEKLTQARSDLANLDAELVQSEDRRRREIDKLKIDIDLARAELALLQTTLKTNAQVLSPVDGVVTELAAGAGEVVNAGQPIASILRDDDNRGRRLEAVLFVPVQHGGRVGVDADVLLTPGSLAPENHDRIRGKVANVSRTPLSRAALQHTLGSADLASSIFPQGAPIAVRVALLSDPNNPARVLWTSPKPPQAKLLPGIPVSAEVTVEHRPLLGLVISALNDLLTGRRKVESAT